MNYLYFTDKKSEKNEVYSKCWGWRHWIFKTKVFVQTISLAAIFFPPYSALIKLRLPGAGPKHSLTQKPFNVDVT